jgi:hypothetical protein
MQNPPFQSVQELFSNITGFLPLLLAGFIVLLVGAALAWLISKLVLRVLLLLRLDRVLARMSWGRALAKGDVRHSIFSLVGAVVGLFVFLVFLENAIVIWKLTVLSDLLQKLVGFIPQLVTASVILLLGWAVAGAVFRAVLRALFQEEFEQARLVARLIRAAILGMTCAIALVELNIAVGIVTGTCLIGIGALALGFALAFGLGSKRAVELMWEKRLLPKEPPASMEKNPEQK